MSSTLVRPDSFLRRVLLADAAVSAAVGLLMAAAAAPLQELLALPSVLLVGAVSPRVDDLGRHDRSAVPRPAMRRRAVAAG
jgi:hypothetical protein